MIARGYHAWSRSAGTVHEASDLIPACQVAKESSANDPGRIYTVYRGYAKDRTLIIVTRYRDGEEIGL